MILEKRADLPVREPVPPCTGWLAHNTQNCDCYAQGRRARNSGSRPFQSRAYTLADRNAFERRYSWPPAQPMPKWLVHLYRGAFALAGLALVALALS